MSKEVRKIFFYLIGTVCIIILISLFAETINISVKGIQMQQITKMACEQSLTLFSQESYKARTTITGDAGGGAIDITDVPDASGNIYVTGSFYNGNTLEEIYNNMYNPSQVSSEGFRMWISSDIVSNKGNWNSVQLLFSYMRNPGKFLSEPDYANILASYGGNSTAALADYERQVEEYTKFSIGKAYAENFVTPMNLGVPYIDQDTLQRMFQWNLARLMSNCQSDKIVPDDYGNTCIRLNGFRVYADRATITGIEYKVYDLSIESDKQEFMRLTNIDPNNLGMSGDITYLGTDTDERQRVMIVSATYSVPIAYEGITPLANMVKYVWDTEVDGWRNGQDRVGGAYTGWDDSTSDMIGGGFTQQSAVGVLPVSNTIVFYVVR